jgi:hypothetical protein
VGKRAPSSFKRLDVQRAIRSARQAGFAPGVVEIETKDGATIRIYAADKAAMAGETSQEVVSAKEWDAEIAKLKAKSGKLDAQSSRKSQRGS